MFAGKDQQISRGEQDNESRDNKLTVPCKTKQYQLLMSVRKIYSMTHNKRSRTSKFEKLLFHMISLYMTRMKYNLYKI